MWLRHWGLFRDPFLGADSPYVSLPAHDEAVALIAHAIDRGERSLALVAEAGLGKTTVVRRAIVETRDPRRRPVVLNAPSERTSLLDLLADGLGRPFHDGSSAERTWRSLVRAVRSAAAEGCHLIIVVDGWDVAIPRAVEKDLAALLSAGIAAGPHPLLIRVGRGVPGTGSDGTEPWEPTVGLRRLTRSQAATYLAAKLVAAGCRDPVFTPQAVTRLHAWSGGVPLGLDQLATRSLIAGAVQGLEVIPPEVLDGVAMTGFPTMCVGSTT